MAIALFKISSRMLLTHLDVHHVLRDLAAVGTLKQKKKFWVGFSGCEC